MSFWRLNLAMWCVFGVLFFMRACVHLDWVPALLLSLFQMVLCLILTGLLQTTYHRIGKRLSFGIQMALWIILLSLGATVIQSMAAHWLIQFTNWKTPSWSMLELWLMRTMFFWLVYMVWSLLFFWIRAEQTARQNIQRAAQAQAEAQRLELQLLRNQLDPHFLFNALNGIASVVQADSPAASAMVRELSDYLRYSLDYRHDTMVPLSREIDAMMSYLHVEQARFSEELHIEITTDEVARRRKVPCFVLLPLVENAVKHSSQACEPPWNVVLTAESQPGRLILEVRNTGTLASHPGESRGAGLDILRRRLNLHYPGRHHLEITENQGMVCARLELEGEPCSV